jgi:hypothetical protein
MNPDTRRAEKQVTLVGLEGDEMVYLGAVYPSTVPEP